jgi:DNA-binding response OmpR family regulator
MGIRILVIGNDLYTEALVSQALSDSDFQVLNIYGNISLMSPSGLVWPALIIFDRLFLGIPDWHTLGQVRQLSPAPIIVLTNSEDSQVRIKSLNLGADCCLSKPLDLDELQAIVRFLGAPVHQFALGLAQGHSKVYWAWRCSCVVPSPRILSS